MPPRSTQHFVRFLDACGVIAGIGVNMDVGADPRSFLQLDADGIAVEDSSTYAGTRKQVPVPLRRAIDGLGELSAKAQSLGAVITTTSKFLAQSDNKIYLKAIGNKVVGFLKTGYRNLFYTSMLGKIVEMRPLCILDFYVHESMQRNGIGKELFDYMLASERVSPTKLAIDRPSPKLVNFMRKHYRLANFVPQNNNFVIFNEYFDTPNAQRGDRQQTQIRTARAEPPARRTEEVVSARNRVPNPLPQQQSTGVQALLSSGTPSMYQTSSSLYGAGVARPASRYDAQRNIEVTRREIEESKQRVRDLERQRVPWGATRAGGEVRTTSADYGATSQFYRRK